MAGDERWAVRRGRRPAARRARRPGAAGRARRLHRAGRGPARRPGRPLRPHPRAVHRRRGRRAARARRRGRASRPWPGSPRRAACSRASSGPPAPGAEWCDAEVLRSLRRRSLAAAAPRGRAGRAGRAGAVPPGLAARRSTGRAGGGRRGCAGRRRGHGRRAARRLRRARLGAGVARAALAGSPTTSRAMLDELTATGEVLWAGHGGLPGLRRLGLAAPRRHRPPDPARPRRARAVRRPRRRCSRRSPAAAPTSSASSPTRSGLDRRQGALGRRSGTSPGRAASATTPSRRCARSPAAAAAPTGSSARPARCAAPGRGCPARPAHGATRGRRALVPAARARARPDQARARGRRGPARATRRGHPRRGDERAHARRVRRGLQGALGLRGDRPLPARLLRRGARRRPVRHGRAPSTGCAPTCAHRRPSREADRAWPSPPTDPANPFGAALPWPAARSRGHRPGARRARSSCWSTASLTLYVERGGKTLLTFTDDEELLARGIEALGRVVREGALGRLTVEKADGASILGQDSEVLRRAMESAGFIATPRGLRLRGSRHARGRHRLRGRAAPRRRL